MEEYIVSARKYRPATFDTVVGQEALTTTLKNAVASGKLAHAYLFCGPRGVGKTTCARIFAKTINCTHLTPEGEPCEQCESCVSFAEGRSFNIHELDAASNNSVDEIRQLVEQVRIPPQVGKYKVYIIDEVHMLSTAAFNAFLKTLEEPPKHAIFILATTEKHKILPTILSRCQTFDFHRISVEDTVRHLAHVAEKEGIKAEAEALNVIAIKADGGMRDALSVFDQVTGFTQGNITYEATIRTLNVLDYDYFFRLTDHLLAHRVREALMLFNEVLSKGFEGNHFITGFTSHLRDLLVSRDALTIPLLQVGASIRTRYMEQAAACTEQFLFYAMQLGNECDLAYRNSKNKRLLVELTLIRIAQYGVSTMPTETTQPLKPLPQPAAQPATVSVQSPPQTASGSTDSAPQTSTAATAVTAQLTTPAITAPTQQSPAPRQTATTFAPSPAASTTRKTAALTGGRRPASISINKAKQTQSVQAGDSTGGDTLQEVATPAGAAFDEATLHHFWRQIASDLPRERQSLAQKMRVVMPMLQEDGQTIRVSVGNGMAQKEFQEAATELTKRLGDYLNNHSIRLQTEVVSAEHVQIPLSKADKFKAMVEKNSELGNLKETFGLEFY